MRAGIPHKALKNVLLPVLGLPTSAIVNVEDWGRRAAGSFDSIDALGVGGADEFDTDASGFNTTQR